MRALNAVSTVMLALALAAVAACSLLEPSPPQEVDQFEYGGYPDSQDRRDCVREADEALRKTGPTGDMYDDTRKRMRLELLGRCMKQRGRRASPR